MLRDIRKQYLLSNLDEKSVLKNPFDQFDVWLQEAINSEQLEPTAMTLSTVDGSGRPHSRIVLLKEFLHEKFLPDRECRKCTRMDFRKYFAE